MKRVMSITAVLAAVTCHSAYGQLDSVGGAAQNAAGQIGSAAKSAAASTSDQVQSQTNDIQADASANTEADANVGDNAPVGNAEVESNANLDADVNTDSGNLQVDGQAGVNATSQNQINRGTRNLNRGINRGLNNLGRMLPPIPQQARAGNSGPYDARWRFTQRNGQWWYYSPQNQWMIRQNDQWQNYNDAAQPLAGGNIDQSAYSSGYRGEMVDQSQYAGQQPLAQGYGNAGMGHMQMTGQSGPVYMLRYDQSGREYICVHGQRVYFDDQSAANMGDQSMEDQPPMPNGQVPNDQADGEDQGNNERYESGRTNLDAADSDNQRPLTQSQPNGEAADASATEPPPAPTADTPADASDADSNTEENNSNDSNDDNAQQSESNDADSDSQPESDDAENDDDESDEA